MGGQPWFGSLHQKPPIDIDGDGLEDLIVGMALPGFSPECKNYVISDEIYSSDAAGDVLFMYELVRRADSQYARFIPVMSGSVLTDQAAALVPQGATPLMYRFVTLHDIDRDRDRDLIVEIRCLYQVSGVIGSVWIWVENTVKANPPLAADINQDGVVDGKDLAEVLAGWTP